MLPYVFLFVLVGVSLFISRALGVIWFYYVAGLALAIFAGLRANIGVDYESYLETFSEIKTGTNLNDLEPMNMAIINFAHFIGAGDALIFSIYSIITLAGVLHFSKKFSSVKELSVFVFMMVSIFYLSTFNLVRQWAAISMMLFAITSLIDRKYYRMAVFIVLANMFHLSAMMLVVIPFMTIRFSKRWVLIMAVTSGLLAELLLLIIENLPFVHYLNEVFRSDRSGSLPLFSLYILFLILSSVYLDYFNNKKLISRRVVIILNMNLLSIFVLLIGFLIGIDFQTAMRANAYFTIQLIILVPWLLGKFDRSSKVVLYPLCLLLLSAVYWNTIYFKGAEYMLTPFKFISL
ncbi:MAG: EpsG family protein [Sideroxyarcus sp.]|nr:EpsG family protein [Sideroxyarcus sp.]